MLFQANIVLILIFAFTVDSFSHSRSTLKLSSAFKVYKNKVNDIEVDGVDFTPICDNIFIKVKEIPATTFGGIVLPDKAKEKPTEGTVIAVGPGKEHPETAFLIKPFVQPGDSVIYGKFDGTELKYNGENHQVIKNEDILLKYKGDKLTLDSVECVRDNILIELPPKEEKSSTGLILTTSEDKKNKGPTNGKVVKVGPGRITGAGTPIPIPLSPGDNVKIGYVRPNEIKIDGKEYTVVRSFDIYAKY